jgi:arsenate reductase
MAEGLLRKLYGNRYEVYSAGTDPTGVNPLAVKVKNPAAVNGSEEEKMVAFRRVRDEIKLWIEQTF